MADQQQIGSWAFMLGVLIAIIAGLAAGMLPIEYGYYISLALVILGLVVGFLNIGVKEVNDFLIAGIALSAVAISAGGLSVIPVVGPILASMVTRIAEFVAPAVLVVALKAISVLAKSPSGK
jgi:hypothetical protein